MKNYMKLLMLGLLGCWLSCCTNKPEQNQSKDLKTTFRIKSQETLFNMAPSSEAIPVKKGEEVTYTITFNNQKVKSITIDNSVGEATKEQMKAGEYTFKVKPEKTTTYTAKLEFFDRDSMIVWNKIIVMDEEGKEIPEK